MHMDKHRVEYAYLPDLLARVCITCTRVWLLCIFLVCAYAYYYDVVSIHTLRMHCMHTSQYPYSSQQYQSSYCSMHTTSQSSSLVLHMHKFWATFGRVRDGVLLFCVHTEADTQVGLGHTVTHVEVLFQLLRSSQEKFRSYQ